MLADMLIWWKKNYKLKLITMLEQSSRKIWSRSLLLLPLQAKDIPILVVGDVSLIWLGLLECHRDSPPVNSDGTTTTKPQGEETFTKGWAGVKCFQSGPVNQRVLMQWQHHAACLSCTISTIMATNNRRSLICQKGYTVDFKVFVVDWLQAHQRARQTSLTRLVLSQ